MLSPAWINRGNATCSRPPPSSMLQRAHEEQSKVVIVTQTFIKNTMKRSQQSVGSSKMKSEERRNVSKRRPIPLHHSEAIAENPANAVTKRSTPSRTPHRSRTSSRAHQCARYLYPAPGWRCTHHKLAASSSHHCSRLVTRSWHTQNSAEISWLHFCSLSTRADSS